MVVDPWKRESEVVDSVDPREAPKVKRLCSVVGSGILYGVTLDDKIIALADVVTEAPPVRKTRKKRAERETADGEDTSAARPRGRKDRGMADPRGLQQTP